MRLFISYAHADRDAVEALASVLNQGGFVPWYDYELVPGDVWRERLAREIAGCEAFLYVLTPESVNSEYCQWEFQKALELGKPVMPVLLTTGVEKLPAFPAILRDRQWVDMSGGLEPANTARLINGLNRLQAQLRADPPPVSAAESAAFIPPGAEKASMSTPPDEDKPRISISQRADHSTNVNQIGYVTGDVNITSGGVSQPVAPELLRLYDRLDQWIAAQTDPVDRADATDAKTQLTSGVKQADETGVRRALRTIKRMAPDIWEVAVATLSNPIAGVGAVIQKVATRAKEEASG